MPGAGACRPDSDRRSDTRVTEWRSRRQSVLRVRELSGVQGSPVNLMTEHGCFRIGVVCGPAKGYAEAAMAPLNIQLPDALRSRVEARAAESGFDNVEAYVQAVLLADAAGGPVVDEVQLESLLLESLDGPFVEADAVDSRRSGRSCGRA